MNKSTGIPGVLLHANAANTMLTGTYLDPVPDSQTLLWVAVITALIGTAVLLLPLWMSVSDHVPGRARVRRLRVHPLQQRARAELRVPVAGGDRSRSSARWACGTSVRRGNADASPRCSRSTCRRPSPNASSTRTAPAAAVEGERLDMTVLFCDLRGFTALSENLEPAIVRMMLNHYYDRVTDIVLAMDGTLMKYVGDEVFAVWGAPLPERRPPAAWRSSAPIAIQALTPELNRELLEQGAPEVSFGIGLNTGRSGGRPLRRWAPPPVRRRRRHRQRRRAALLGRGPRRDHPVRPGADPGPVATAGRAGRSGRAQGRESRAAPLASGAAGVG